MKHLKKFNEELNINTYRRTVNKLKEIGHKKRSANMQSWVDIKQKEQEEKDRLLQIEKWKDSISKYSQFGKFKFEISDSTSTRRPNARFEPIVDDFYTVVSFDIDMFGDSVQDTIEWSKNTVRNPSGVANLYLSLFVSAVPTTEEDYDKYQSIPAIKGSMWGGGIFGLWVSIKIEIQGDLISVSDFEVYTDDGQDTFLKITDRSTAGKIRNLLLGIFKGTIDYPVKYPTHGYPTNLHDFIETAVCNKSGLTSDYGLNMDHFVEAIQKVSANSLFKES
jgi:hypothetical protein